MSQRGNWTLLGLWPLLTGLHSPSSVLCYIFCPNSNQGQFQLHPQSLGWASNRAKQGNLDADARGWGDRWISESHFYRAETLLASILYFCRIRWAPSTSKQPKGVLWLLLQLVANHIKDTNVLNFFHRNSTHHGIMTFLSDAVFPLGQQLKEKHQWKEFRVASYFTHFSHLWGGPSRGKSEIMISRMREVTL